MCRWEQNSVEKTDNFTNIVILYQEIIMNENERRSADFLLELYRRTEGLVERQVSMHDVGAAIGLEKSEAGALAEELIMEELVELKTLAGGIGITTAGIDLLQKNGKVDAPVSNSSKLSGKPILTDDDRVVLTEIIREIQTELPLRKADYRSLEEIIIDIKTIEVQLLSTRPKAAIILAVLGSLQKAMQNLGLDATAAKLKQLHC
jgi:hypothetical protein